MEALNNSVKAGRLNLSIKKLENLAWLKFEVGKRWKRTVWKGTIN